MHLFQVGVWVEKSAATQRGLTVDLGPYGGFGKEEIIAHFLDKSSAMLKRGFFFWLCLSRKKHSRNELDPQCQMQTTESKSYAASSSQSALFLMLDPHLFSKSSTTPIGGGAFFHKQGQQSGGSIVWLGPMAAPKTLGSGRPCPKVRR